MLKCFQQVINPVNSIEFFANFVYKMFAIN